MAKARRKSAAHKGAVVGSGQARICDGSPVVITMPMPPSINQAYKNTARGRAKTETTIEWERRARWMIRAQNPFHISGPVVVIFGFERSNDRADADNRLKLAQDALETAAIIPNDANVLGFAGGWLPWQSGLCHVAIYPAHRAPPLKFSVSDDGAYGAWMVQSDILEGDLIDA